MYRLPTWARVRIWLRVYWYVPVLGVLMLVAGFVLLAGSGGRDKQAWELLRVGKKMRERRAKVDTVIKKRERDAQQEIRLIEFNRDKLLVKVLRQQSEEYRAVRKRGPKAVAKWLNDFDRSMR